MLFRVESMHKAKQSTAFKNAKKMFELYVQFLLYHPRVLIIYISIILLNLITYLPKRTDGKNSTTSRGIYFIVQRALLCRWDASLCISPAISSVQITVQIQHKYQQIPVQYNCSTIAVGDQSKSVRPPPCNTGKRRRNQVRKECSRM